MADTRQIDPTTPPLDPPCGSDPAFLKNGGLELMDLYRSIADKRVRNALLDLMKSLAILDSSRRTG